MYNRAIATYYNGTIIGDIIFIDTNAEITVSFDTASGIRAIDVSFVFANNYLSIESNISYRQGCVYSPKAFGTADVQFKDDVDVGIFACSHRYRYRCLD